MTTKRSLKESIELQEKANQIIVGGSQGHKRFQLPYPLFVEKSKGSHFWDVDGNDYIDYLLSYGPILLGHAYPKVTNAIFEHVQNGNLFSITHPLELELAEKLIHLIPSAEMVTYFVGGSSATAGAIRLARAYTGREKVVRCGYHGWFDWCFHGSGALLATTAYTLEMRYNDSNSLEELFKAHKGGIACVIMEPVGGQGHELPCDGYLEGVKKLVHDNGALLIFDEVKSGFRYALGGAQEHFGVVPDLSVFSKAMGNGYPIAAVVGKREILSGLGGVPLGATFHGEISMVVAALTTISEMVEQDGVSHLWKQGEKLLAGYREICDRLQIEEARCEGAGPMPFFGFDKKDERTKKLSSAFYRETLDRGLFLHDSHVAFLSLSHTDEDISKTLEIFEDALRSAKQVA